MGKYNLVNKAIGVGLVVGLTVCFGACGGDGNKQKVIAKTWLQRFMELELDSLVARNSEGTKITMVTDAAGASNDNGQGLETEKFHQLDYRAEMDGIMEYAAVNIEDAAKFDKWVDSSINRQGLWMRITHYSSKDTGQGLQAVDIYELEQRTDASDAGWLVNPSISGIGTLDSPSILQGKKSTAAHGKQFQCYLVTWDFRQRTWWVDRDIRAFYQKGAKSFGYKIREDAIWGSPKGLDVQVNLSNELWLNND